MMLDCRHAVSQQKLAAIEKLAIIFVDGNLEREALASCQQVRLLTTALLNEVRASASVGGGGREGGTDGEDRERKRAVGTGGTDRQDSEPGRCVMPIGSPISRA